MRNYCFSYEYKMCGCSDIKTFKIVSAKNIREAIEKLKMNMSYEEKCSLYITSIYSEELE